MHGKEQPPMPDQPTQFIVPNDTPLIAIPYEENGASGVRYFTSDEAADNATSKERSIAAALATAGATADLDWQETLTALERMDQEVPPTPILDEL